MRVLNLCGCYNLIVSFVVEIGVLCGCVLVGLTFVQLDMPYTMLHTFERIITF